MRGASFVAAAVVSSLWLLPGVARATGVMEFPDNGSEQEGRGGAWVARASDPLATFYNPAGLAGQPTRVTLQANLSMQNTCFTRLKAGNDVTNDGTNAGSTYPQVCNNGSLFPDPQLAFTYRLTDRIGLGIAVLGPSAVGNVTWPDFINGNTPSPQRYLLVSSNVVLLTPTVGVGWEAIDNLRLGAAFIAGTAPSIDFINVSPALAEPSAASQTPGTNDVRSELKAHDYFIPGFTLGAIWTPIDRLDIAAWYKYMAPIDATGDVITQAYYYQYAQTNPNKIAWGDTAYPACYNPGTATPSATPCGNGGNAKVNVTLPMEAKLGFRYHQPRSDVPAQAHVRDPMATDVFDAELDLTWANNSAFDSIQIRFPGDSSGKGILPANPAIPGNLPPNADVRHHFKDVFGVRLGGDYNVLPDQLALRAGAFFETAAADTTYQNIDFIASDRIGFALGGTYRIKFSESNTRGGNALDIMAGYGHVFFGTLTNNGPNGLNALSGEQCAAGSTPQAGGVCSNGNTQYRSLWPVNLGTITSAINVINVGASYRF
ncbi:MAG TPA: outer membrane protein transport protein [Polyangiaceae bacterium]